MLGRRELVHLVSNRLWLRFTNLSCSAAVHAHPNQSSTCEHPDVGEDFWAEQAEQLEWFRKWDKVVDHSNPPFTKWFSGGILNTCFNAVDRHVTAGFGKSVAINYDSPVTNTKASVSFNKLLEEVSALASALSKLGCKRGDVVLIYMPMIPNAIYSMLACARIGAVHTLVFGGFAPKQLAIRIAHCRPKVILTANYGVEPGRTIPYLPAIHEAVATSGFKPKWTIVYNRPQFDRVSLKKEDGELDYNDVISSSPKSIDCVPVHATDPLYILYTSGTTGAPKAPVRPSGGHAVALNWSMKGIYGLSKGEPWFAASDLGWVVGHSYGCYAPLLHRNPTLMYEGKPVGTPDAGAFFRLVEEYKLTSIFISPTALRAIKRVDPAGSEGSNFDLSSLKSVFVAGEHLDVPTLEWTRQRFGNRPTLDHWWQTETGWAISSTCIGDRQLCQVSPPPPGSVGKQVPGWIVEVLRPDGSRAAPNELGTIAVRLPLPPGSFSTLYNSEEKFISAYHSDFPGYYSTMDAGYVDKDGYIFVMGRTDDVINVAGHRLSTGSLEEAIQMVDSVAEAAVVGKDDDLKGQVPFAFCVLKNSSTVVDPVATLEKIKRSVRDNVGPIAALSGGAIIVPRLPKTRSGKVARNTLAAMVNHKPYTVPVTIEDPSVYAELSQILVRSENSANPPQKQ